MLQDIKLCDIKVKDIEKEVKYPLLEIDLEKIYKNTKYMVELCDGVGISVAGVVKGFNALPEVVEQMSNAGCKYIATSRMNQIKELREQKVDKPIMLVRIPMYSEIDELVEYVDISLNSELETLNKIQKQCSRVNKTHKVILMIDLGDLREGVMDEKEFIDLAVYVEDNLPNVHLYGIGTNLGCYGSIKPSEVNLGKLCDVAEKIEEIIGRKLDVISGGATSSIPLIIDGVIPEKINNLRLGEGIILAKDLDEFWGYDMSPLSQDTFVLKAQIVEIKDKPSYPVGEIFIDAFGNKPTYVDRGVRKRAILGIGKQDVVFYDTLMPRDKDIEIIGASSDHLIIDIEDCSKDYNIGDIITFELYYPHMLYLSGASWINKIYK